MNSRRKPTAPSDWPYEQVLRAFDRTGVRFLIIGGQAALVYGASQFTRDADFWVEPTRGNLAALKKALHGLGARQRFLPALTLSYLRKGHGVHFVIPVRDADFYVDILGKPPRVSNFRDAYKAALTISWRGLVLRVLDIPRLVETKKTNRDSDYLSIRLLAEMVFEGARTNPRHRGRNMEWLLRESRTPEHLLAIVRAWKGGRTMALASGRTPAVLAAKGATKSAIKTALFDEMTAYQKANIDYWKPFIRELKSLRKKRLRGKNLDRMNRIIL